MLANVQHSNLTTVLTVGRTVGKLLARRRRLRRRRRSRALSAGGQGAPQAPCNARMAMRCSFSGRHAVESHGARPNESCALHRPVHLQSTPLPTSRRR